MIDVNKQVLQRLSRPRWMLYAYGERLTYNASWKAIYLLGRGGRLTYVAGNAEHKTDIRYLKNVTRLRHLFKEKFLRTGITVTAFKGDKRDIPGAI